jgi:nitronate monooxygenase
MTAALFKGISIIQAPMAGVTTPELVAAVSNAGGLGSVGAGYMSPEAIRQFIQEVRKLTQKPFAVNLFIPNKTQHSPEKIQKMNKILDKYRRELNIALSPPIKFPSHTFEDQFKVLIDEKVPIFSFTFGIADANCINQCKANNIISIGTATSCKEALALAESGIDAIVAQGSEAGAHRGTFLGCAEDSLIGTLALVPQVVDAVPVPVIAAGGIMDARGILAARDLGAKAVQMGTAFLACPESGATQKYKQAVCNADAGAITLTRAFSGRLARGIRNRFIDDMMNQLDAIPDYPIQHYLTQDIREAAKRIDNIDFMSLWAGQSAHLAKPKPAGELTKDLINALQQPS